MKTLIRTLLAVAAGGLLAVAPARAQTVANGNFETWATRYGVQLPTNWLTFDDLLGGALPTGTVSRTTVAHGGAAAVQIQTQTLPGLGQIPGYLILGTAFRGGSGIPGGLPFTGRPRSLQFYYQLSGSRALGDSAAMFVLLTRRLNGVSTVVAGASYVFNALAPNYTLVTVPLQYAAGLAPDSVSMVFYSGSAGTVTSGTVLRIDDIAFTGTASATRDAGGLAAAFSAAPNPSPDGRYTLQGLDPALLSAPLTVLDAAGRVVRRERPTAQDRTRVLDLSALPGGLYHVQLFTPDGLITRRLLR